jgi:RNA polymerase sigma-70 factor (ECF subfamily)
MSESRDPEIDIDISAQRMSANEISNGNHSRSAHKAAHATLNDHQLLNAYSLGDEHAFEILVEKYFRMVYAVAARQTGDSHLAEEIAQSVFLILSRKARGFSSSASIPGWLLRTTRFVCLDAIKMRRRRAENEQKLAVNLEHQHQPDAEPTTMELLLDDAIQALRPDEQASIAARFFEGKNFQEIARMFAITEHAARKRTSRCLAKLQAFMEKRRAKVSLETLSGLLIALPRHEATSQALQSAIRTTHAVWKGKVAAGNSIALADHALRLLRWRLLADLSLRFALPVLVIFIAIWSVPEIKPPVLYRLEKLGKAWAAFDNLVAQHRQFMMQTPPNAPNYQTKVQQDFAAISRESTRIIEQLNPLLTPPDERNRLAIFLTAELSENLKLAPSQKAALLSYIQNRLGQGPTFNDAMKFIAQTTDAETNYIKAMLSPEQQQFFNKIYGADGVLLFSYPKAVALKRIGP